MGSGRLQPPFRRSVISLTRAYMYGPIRGRYLYRLRRGSQHPIKMRASGNRDNLVTIGVLNARRRGFNAVAHVGYCGSVRMVRNPNPNSNDRTCPDSPTHTWRSRHSTAFTCIQRSRSSKLPSSGLGYGENQTPCLFDRLGEKFGAALETSSNRA